MKRFFQRNGFNILFAVIIVFTSSYNGKAQHTKVDPTQNKYLLLDDRIIEKVSVFDSDGKEITKAKTISKTVSDEVLQLKKKAVSEVIRLKFEFSKAKLYSFSFGEFEN